MAYTNLRIILYLILLPVSGYYILKLFGKLAGINMFSAMAWAFRTKKPKGYESVRPLFYGAIFLYLLAFTLLFVFLDSIPRQIFYMNKYHAGGLLGYRDAGLQARVYDPSRRDYVAYTNITAPLPANKFTETFEVVLLYKPPSSDYYQDTEMLSLPINIAVVFSIAFILFAVYGILYKLTEDYIDQNSVRKKLSHHFMADRFRKIVGLPPWKALMIFLSVLVLIIGISAISVKRLINHYSDLYGSHQKMLRSALLKKVSPRGTVTGYVIRRFKTQESESHSTEGADGRTRQETKYYTVLHYTVEFRDLIHIPVYLDLAFHRRGAEVAMLDKPFRDTMTVVPHYFKEYAFIVNPDYSISLKGNREKPQE